MRKLLFVALVALVGCPKQNADTPAAEGASAGAAAESNKAPVAASEVSLETEDGKTLYALGLTLGRSIEVFDLKADELDLVFAGIRDHFAEGEPKVNLQEYNRKVGELARRRGEEKAQALASKTDAFVAAAAAEEGATKTASGLIFRNVEEGSGESPTETSRVKVHYRGTLVDGTEFDSSYKRNEPATFPLNGVIPCWTEGVQLMKVGGKARLVCPPDIAYGATPRPGLPANSTLNFEVELLEVLPAAPVPPSPANPHGAPKPQPNTAQGQPAAE